VTQQKLFEMTFGNDYKQLVGQCVDEIVASAQSWRANYLGRTDMMLRYINTFRIPSAREFRFNKATALPKEWSLIHFRTVGIWGYPLVVPVQQRLFWAPSLKMLAKGKTPKKTPRVTEDSTTSLDKLTEEQALSNVLLQNQKDKAITQATLEKMLPTLSPPLVFPLIKQNGVAAFAHESATINELMRKLAQSHFQEVMATLDAVLQEDPSLSVAKKLRDEIWDFYSV